MSENGSKYNFYEENLWIGRLGSFTKSIDSNLKLLRVILLTKGSSIMEFGLLLDKVEGLLTEKEDIDRKKVNNWRNKVREAWHTVQESIDSLDEPFQKIAVKSLPDALEIKIDLIKSEAQNISSKVPAKRDIHDEGRFDFEEVQLYNLRTLSIKQKRFVENRLRRSVGSALNKDGTSGVESDRVADVRKSFQYIAGDIEIVQRAIVQRVHEVNDAGQYKPSMQASALQITDRLALMALQPFQHLLPSNSEITPITFFSQETHIRSLPYCDDVVLIGIRYDQVLQDLENEATPPPFELLAIPHEIGHYVYQRGTIEAKSVDVDQIIKDVFSQAPLTVKANEEPLLDFTAVAQKLPLANERYRKWCEEIFSDICGCMVAGPLVALSLLSILVARTEKANKYEEGEHPTGNLRPYLLKEILIQLNKINNKYDFELAAKDIVATWEDTLAKSGRQKKSDASQVPDDLQKIIRVFAKILMADAPAEFKLWRTAKMTNLTDCATELKQIPQMIGFESVEPSKLVKEDPADGTDIALLVNEWQKKGPVTIGDHD